jgi:uncharacterized membrane protein YdbT with pleckstrin-like domain
MRGKSDRRTGKLLAIDGLATGTVTVRKVAALEHELKKEHGEVLIRMLGPHVRVKDTYAGDDAVERATRVAKPMLARRELTEVLSSLRDDVVIELERNATSRLRVHRDIELKRTY